MASPTPLAATSTPKPMSPASSMSFAKNTSATLTAPAPSRPTFQTIEHGAQRLRRDDEPQPVRDVAPVAARHRLLGAELVSGIRVTSAAETRNVTALTAYGTDGPQAVYSSAPTSGPIVQREVLDGLDAASWHSRAPRPARGSGVQRSPPGRRSRSRHPRRRRATTMPSGLSDERQRGEHAEAHEIRADHEPAAREPVDERAEQEADDDDRQEVRDQEGGDPDARSGQIPDLRATSAIAARYVPKLDPAVARKRYPNDGDRRRRPRRLVLFTSGDDATSVSRFRLRLFGPCPKRTWANCSAPRGQCLRGYEAPRIATFMRCATRRARAISLGAGRRRDDACEQQPDLRAPVTQEHDVDEEQRGLPWDRRRRSRVDTPWP